MRFVLENFDSTGLKITSTRRGRHARIFWCAKCTAHAIDYVILDTRQ